MPWWRASSTPWRTKRGPPCCACCAPSCRAGTAGSPACAAAGCRHSIPAARQPAPPAGHPRRAQRRFSSCQPHHVTSRQTAPAALAAVGVGGGSRRCQVNRLGAAIGTSTSSKGGCSKRRQGRPAGDAMLVVQQRRRLRRTRCPTPRRALPAAAPVAVAVTAAAARAMRPRPPAGAPDPPPPPSTAAAVGRAAGTGRSSWDCGGTSRRGATAALSAATSGEPWLPHQVPIPAACNPSRASATRRCSYP